MKKFYTISLVLLFVINIFCSYSQKYVTKTGHMYFISRTDIIDIDANNNKVAAILDVKTGEIFIIALIKAFEFTLATADKHFNETYMESDLYPKATFQGKISKIKEIDLKKNGEYDVIAEGSLTIHGQTKTISKPGKVKIQNGTISLNSGFQVPIADYNIKVPKNVENRVAKIVDIKFDTTLELQK